MKALIFVEQDEEDSEGAEILEHWLWELGCARNKFFRIGYLVKGTDTSINTRIYSVAMRFRIACKESEEHSAVIVGYPKLINLGFQQANGWGSLHSHVMRWSSARYEPCIVHSNFISAGGTLEQLQDMIEQNVEVRNSAARSSHRGLQYKMANLAGGDDPSVVLVGDKHNHPKGAMWPQPFLSVVDSSHFLHSALLSMHMSPTVGVPRNYPWCFNANDENSSSVFEWLTTTGTRRYIALGENASSWLGTFPHVKIPHPSWVNRFKKMTPFKYGMAIKQAIEEATWA